MIEITPELIKTILPKRSANSHKGTYGKVLNIVGTEEYIGAGILCALGSLKVGAGYSILCSTNQAINYYKNYSPDIIYKSHGNFNYKKIIDILNNENINAIVLGCGISTSNKAILFVEKIMKKLLELNIPTVIDADGLNCISKIGIKNLNQNFILTPHPKELSNLINIDIKEIQLHRKVYIQKAQKIFNATIVLKGHETLICENKNIYKNTTGNNALAKAGTGDVLAGMIGGFCAQTNCTKNSALLGVYIHGLGGDLYKANFSEYSLLASDLLNYIPQALKLTLCH